ncbi:MAG TPA: RCC1 domain-containing protein [Candidatus Thermoplasmatota archaeon]
MDWKRVPLGRLHGPFAHRLIAWSAAVPAAQATQVGFWDATGVAAGGFHTCVLKSNGNVDCYGNDGYGQASNYEAPSAPPVRTRGNSDGSTTAYHDQNHNGQPDQGEPQATTLVVRPKTLDHADGTCTLYNDLDDDNQADGEEVVAANFACPKPKTEDSPDGTTLLYDDKNGNDQPDPGEPIGTVPGTSLIDADQDRVPDALELQVCDRAITRDVVINPNSSTTAHCTTNTDYTPPVVRPQTLDNADGSCTLYNDADDDHVIGAGEHLTDYPCPDPKTRTNPDGSTTLYDDKDDDDEVDPGEELAVANPKVRDNPDGSCTLYNDADADEVTDAGETIGDYPCPDPKTRTNPDGSTTLYDDKDDDDEVDPGEELATGNPKVHENLDGSCTAYNDADGDDAKGPGEDVTEYPCPQPRSQQNPDGSVTLYVDEDGDDQPDPEEPQATTPVVRPRTRDNGDGSCTLYNDVDADESLDAGEALSDYMCRMSVPTGAQHGPDEDNDLVPSGVMITFTNVVVRPDIDPPVTTATPSALFVPLDPDDSDPFDPVPWDGFDADRDGVADGAEPWLCLAKLQSDPSDGSCNPSMTDYTPPAPLPPPNPWNSM